MRNKKIRFVSGMLIRDIGCNPYDISNPLFGPKKRQTF